MSTPYFARIVRVGNVEVVLEERDSAWVDVHDELKWLSDREQFTWISERDGWRHVYLVSRDGQQQRLITPGDFDVLELLHVDEASGHAYLLASPGQPDASVSVPRRPWTGLAVSG